MIRLNISQNRLMKANTTQHNKISSYRLSEPKEIKSLVHYLLATLKVFLCCWESFAILQACLSLSIYLFLAVISLWSLFVVCQYKKKSVVSQTASSRMGMRQREGSHEKRARKRTGWKVHIESKTQACWFTFVLANDVHENALIAQDTSVSRIHLSSARLE